MFGENWSKGDNDASLNSGRDIRRVTAGAPYLQRYRKPENAPRGRMSAYAFFIQTCREELRQQNPGETIVFKDFSRKCADRWKALAADEKQIFSDMAAHDRARYAKELESYQGPRIRNRRRKMRKDPRAPKRALDERPKVRAQLPNANVGVVAKELAALWSSATPDVKEKYERMAEKDKVRYEQEMVEYRNGNFSRPVDGFSDLPPPDPNNLGKIPNIPQLSSFKRKNFEELMSQTSGMRNNPLVASVLQSVYRAQREPVQPQQYSEMYDDEEEEVSDEECLQRVPPAECEVSFNQMAGTSS